MKNKTLKIIIVVLALALAATGGALAINLLKPEIVPPNPVGTPNEPPQINEKPVPEKNPSSTNSSNGTSNKKDDSSSKTTNSLASSSKPASKVPVSSIPTPATNEKKVVRGKIVSISTSFITIKEEKTGKEMSFYRESAEVDGKLAEDLTAEISYLGENEDDAYVTKIVTFLS